MSSIAERLTRAYCLFHWLQVKPIPETVRQSIAFKSLEQELLSLKVQPEDLAAVGTAVTENFEESRLAFMVRYSGLTWSTCSIFCDAVSHRDYIQKGAPMLVRFQNLDLQALSGLPDKALNDFAFLNPTRMWMENGRLLSFMVRWNPEELKRMERFIRLTSARHGGDASVHLVTHSEKFIQAIKATVGA